jgi:hypothetical protein
MKLSNIIIVFAYHYQNCAYQYQIFAYHYDLGKYATLICCPILLFYTCKCLIFINFIYMTIFNSCVFHFNNLMYIYIKRLYLILSFHMRVQTYACGNLRFQSESKNCALESERLLYVLSIYTLCHLSHFDNFCMGTI